MLLSCRLMCFSNAHKGNYTILTREKSCFPFFFFEKKKSHFFIKVYFFEKIFPPHRQFSIKRAQKRGNPRMVNIKCIKEFSGHDYCVWSVAWSADGKYLASCSSDKSIYIYAQRKNTETNELEWAPKVHIQEAHMKAV